MKVLTNMIAARNRLALQSKSLFSSSFSTLHSRFNSPILRAQGKRFFSSEAKETASSSAKPSFFQSETWTKTVGTIGAIANWGIPLAAISHVMSGKDPVNTIDPRMTTALVVYSAFFMRWALAITPPNYPLLICHMSNEAVQIVQLYRHYDAKWSQAEKGEVVKAE